MIRKGTLVRWKSGQRRYVGKVIRIYPFHGTRYADLIVADEAVSRASLSVDRLTKVSF